MHAGYRGRRRLAADAQKTCGARSHRLRQYNSGMLSVQALRMLARSDDQMVVPIIFLCVFALFLFWGGALWLRERTYPKQIGRRLSRFFDVLVCHLVQGYERALRLAAHVEAA